MTEGHCCATTKPILIPVFTDFDVPVVIVPIVTVVHIIDVPCWVGHLFASIISG
jgi:hypothetical protein